VISRIFTGEVFHSRLAPVRHTFRYPHRWVAIDLDELPALNQNLRGFSYNRFNLLSIHDRDYLFGAGGLRERIYAYLAERDFSADVARVELVTAARFMGYAFNPVSFYYAYRSDGSVRCILAEVNNTFGERHLYLLADPIERGGDLLRYSTAKQFHVSPFFDRTGHYEFSLSTDPLHMQIGINLVQNGEVVIVTRIAGRAKPLTMRNLVTSMLGYPVSVLMTVPRIMFQAAKLHFRKGLPVHPTPPLTHPDSHRTSARRE